MYAWEIQQDPNIAAQRGQCPVRSVCVRGTTIRKSRGATNANRCKQQIADRCSRAADRCEGIIADRCEDWPAYLAMELVAGE